MLQNGINFATSAVDALRCTIILECCPHKMNQKKSRGNGFLNSKSSLLKIFATMYIWKWISTYLGFLFNLIFFFFFGFLNQKTLLTNEKYMSK